MWNPNIRPYGECFALNQAVTGSQETGNSNEFLRLDQSQGGTAIRVVTPREPGSSLTVPSGGRVTLFVSASATEDGSYENIGSANYANGGSSAVVFGPDSLVCEFILPQAVLKYPYILIFLEGSGNFSGTVDVYPHHVSHPRR